ncbi:hypothetical protein ALT1545_50133 [Alteromonas macleodii]
MLRIAPFIPLIFQAKLRQSYAIWAYITSIIYLRVITNIYIEMAYR